MKQIVQTVANGQLKIVEVPQPAPGPTEVLVATRRSLLSAGTERAVRQLASANLFQKAKARPDLVKQVISRARRDGIRSTVDAVRTRLGDEMPLGYSGAGIAVSVGEHVEGIRPGMRVATASAGHAEYQVVPGLLSVPIPETVSDEAAAFGAVAAIALQGLRQAEVGVGGSVCVIGLGLVGQLTVRLALAAGLNVAGIDLREWCAALASKSGALGMLEEGEATTDRLRKWARHRGADAVILTAATPSSEPVRRAGALLRDRGRIVVVGDVGLDLDRRPFYENEFDLRFARSYGPGRYDRSYEEWGVDYPIGHVRWTEGRNIETYLDLVAHGKVLVDDLITHVFRIDQAAEAYSTMQSDRMSLAIQLSYDASDQIHKPSANYSPRRSSGLPKAGIIGAGHYARATFLPAMKAAGWTDSLMAVTSSKGLSARHLAERYGIPSVFASADDLLNEPEIDIIFVLSRHDSHADLVVKALDAGKHVYVEKPLALTLHELELVRAAYARNSGHLVVGFNRRQSEATRLAAKALSGIEGPLAISYRVNAGSLPSSHWYYDRKQGGRIIGEACHYIDFVNGMVGTPPTHVSAIGEAKNELLLTEDVSILLGYPDGSSATVTYNTHGWTGAPKESISISGRGKSIEIDDFRSIRINGSVSSGKTFDKGHVSSLVKLHEQLKDVKHGDPNVSFDTTETALRVIAALAGVNSQGNRAQSGDEEAT